MLDYHIPNLLVFPPKAQLYNHPLVEDGSLILQVQYFGSFALDFYGFSVVSVLFSELIVNNPGSVGDP